jgi:hypothetical protein
MSTGLDTIVSAGCYYSKPANEAARTTHQDARWLHRLQ